MRAMDIIEAGESETGPIFDAEQDAFLPATWMVPNRSGQSGDHLLAPHPRNVRRGSPICRIKILMIGCGGGALATMLSADWQEREDCRNECLSHRHRPLILLRASHVTHRWSDLASALPRYL